MSILARLSLANRVLIALATVATIAFGVVATASLRQELLPSFEIPTAAVVTPYQGASPAIVEQEVTEPVEGAAEGVDGVTETSSTSSKGLSVVQVEFEYGTNLDDATGELQQAVGGLSGDLPQGSSPTVAAGSTDDFPVIFLAASSDGSERQLADGLNDEVIPEIESIPGVSGAALSGVRDDVISVDLNERKLAAAGLGVPDVTNALQNNGVAVPGGTLNRDERTLPVEVGEPFRSVQEIKDIYIAPAPGQAGAAAAGQEQVGGAATPPSESATGTPPSGSTGATAPSGAPAEPGVAATPTQPEAAIQAGPVRLGSVADVNRSLADSSSITRTDGKASLAISVTKTRDGNAVDISSAARDKLPGLEDRLGNGAELTVVFDQAPFIEESIDGLTSEGALGLGFAVLVILVFLVSVRSTLVTAVSIPLSLLIAMIGLWTGGYSLNVLTLGALTVAVGRVVDDSIVVLENIKRHLGYGEPRQTAVTDGVREVAGAITASTLTTVAVFLPIAFVGGQVGELFRPFSVTVALALAGSLLVSLTVIPVLAYWFLKPPTVPEGEAERVRQEALVREWRNPLQRAYVPIIRWATRFRVITLVLAAAVFAGTLALVPQLQTNFLDEEGQNTYSINQRLPAGTSLRQTDDAAKKIENVLDGMGPVETYQVLIGSSDDPQAVLFGGDLGSNEAQFNVTTDIDADQAAFEDRLRDRIDDLSGVGEVEVQGGGGPQASALEVVVQAGNDDALRAAARRVENAVADTPRTADVSNNLAADEPSIQVTAKKEAAARAGLTEVQLGQIVQQAFQGAPVGTATVGGDQQDVVIREGSVPDSLEDVRTLEVPAATGGQVRLDSVATVREVSQPVQVTHTDGERSATITATATGQNLGAITADMQSRLNKLDLPDGATYQVAGASSEQRQAFSQLGLAMLAAIAIVFMIMVATFRSLVQPIILLVSIPFAATGVIGALLITGTPLGVPGLIGALMLVGIVVTNAIVLIDLINQYRARGMSARDAVIEGGRRRVRPILMTAAATICALFPLALGLTGGGVFVSQPLAIVVIGGLVTSTLLTLVLVPTLYSIAESVKGRFRRRRTSPDTGTTADPAVTPPPPAVSHTGPPPPSPPARYVSRQETEPIEAQVRDLQRLPNDVNGRTARAEALADTLIAERRQLIEEIERSRVQERQRAIELEQALARLDELRRVLDALGGDSRRGAHRS